MSKKFKVGDRVTYLGLIGVVKGVTVSAGSGLPMLDLVSEFDAELSCTAMESDCDPYEDQEIDQKAALNQAFLESFGIQNAAGRLTDKYLRDGNH